MKLQTLPWRNEKSKVKANDMVFATRPPNPLIDGPEAYCTYEPDGFMWVDTVGFFKELVPKRKFVRFDAKRFAKDAAKMGFEVSIKEEGIFFHSL